MAARGLLRNGDGAVAIELGFVLLPLLILVMGSIEMMLALFIGSTLESAVQQASRYGITGFITDGVSREQKVRQIVADRTIGIVDMDRVEIQTLVYENFEDVGQPEPYTDSNANGAFDPGESYTDVNGNGQWDDDMGAAGLGGPGDVVVYRVSYPWFILTPLIETVSKTPITHRASIAVRNEPF